MSQYVTGDKELIAKLQDLGKKHAGAAIRRGSRAGAKIIAAAAKDNAPVKTGELKSTIKVRALPRKKNVVGCQVIEIGPFVGFLEFGTKHQTGEHKFEQAADASKDEAMDTFIDVLKSEIEERMKQ